MIIPDFDHNDVLPPHKGDPKVRADLSPYKCSILEVCQRFATTKHRVKILRNLILFRDRMTNLNITTGFQLLGGSFLQDIEKQESRDPKDLDVITFFGGLSRTEQVAIVTAFPEFGSFALSKSHFLLDHYPVDYCSDPELTVEQTRYWVQLFSHTRSGVWKGMIRISIGDVSNDKLAVDYLDSTIL